MSISNRWFVIINPVAGKCNGLYDWPLISKLLRDSDVEYDAVFTEKKYHAIELTVEAINKSYRKIIVVGGDGTLHEVVNGIFIQKKAETRDIAIGVIPVGTGNDWVRMYGIPSKYTDCIKAITGGKSVLQDIGLISYYESKVNQTRYMANMTGFGLDAYVNERYTKKKEKGVTTGRLTYIITLIHALLTYRSIKMKIWVDGVMVLESKVLTGAIAIGKYNGGGMLQAPDAIMDDGLFDVTIIDNASSLTVVRYFRALFDGNIYKVPQAKFFRGKNIRIESERGIIEVDGEPLGISPFEFNGLNKMVRVIVGDTYSV